VAITPAGGGAGLHPQAQPEGRSEAEDGAARLFLYWQEWPRPSRSPDGLCEVATPQKSRAAVAGLRRFRPDRPLEGRRAAAIPARAEP
jgi:hypothetical protein